VRFASFMSAQRRFIAPLCLLFAALSPALLAGCGSPGATICEDTCDCTGCSTAALDTCYKTFDDNEKVAGDIGCEEPYADFSACVADRGQCIGSEYKVGGCEIEQDRFVNCLLTAKCGIDGQGRIRCF